jgi:hypothetical protein
VPAGAVLSFLAAPAIALLGTVLLEAMENAPVGSRVRRRVHLDLDLSGDPSTLERIDWLCAGGWPPEPVDGPRSSSAKAQS